MKTKYCVRYRLPLLCVGLLWACITPAVNSTPALLPLRELEEIRATAQQALESRFARDGDSAKALDLAVTLDNAIEYRNSSLRIRTDGIEYSLVTLVLRYRNGRWLEPEVGGFNRHLADRFRLHDIDLSRLFFDDNKLEGSISLISSRGARLRQMGSTSSMHGHLSSGTRPYLRWNIGLERLQPWTQTFDLRAELQGNAREYRLNLYDGIQFEQERRRLEVTIQRSENAYFVIRHDGDRIIESHGRTPSWNRGLHEALEGQLESVNDRLSGRIKVRYNADSWVPNDGRSRIMQYELTGELRFGEIIDGTYVATGDFGSYTGRFGGTVWQMLTGVHTVEDREEVRRGYITGGAVIPPISAGLPPPERSVTALLPDAGALAAAALGAEIYHDLLAMHAAWYHYPMQWEVARRALHCGRPDWRRLPADEINPAVDAYLEALAVQARNLLAEMQADNDVLSGIVESADPRFGPYGKVQPLPDGEALPHTPGAVDQWSYLEGWRTLGPFVTETLPAQAAAWAPEVALDTELPYEGNWRDYGLNLVANWAPAEQRGVFTALNRADWDKLWVRARRLSTYGDHLAETQDDEERKMIVEESSRAYHWYARTEMKSSQAREAWIALRFPAHGSPYGRLWVNGVLRWVSGDYYTGNQYAVFQIPLQRGKNTLVVQTGESISYFPGYGKGWSVARAAQARARFELYLCTAGEPRPGGKPATAPQVNAGRGARGDGSAVFPDTNPPLAWNIEQNINVLWRSAAGGSNADPVVWEDKLFVSAGPGGLICFEKLTGKIKWRASDDGSGGAVALEAAPLVTDRHVLAHYSNGALACYNHAGSLLWRADAGFANSVLSYAPLAVPGADGQPALIVLMNDCQVSDDAGRRTEHGVTAYDFKTGQRVWQSAGLPEAGGGMALLPLLKGTAPQYFIVTGSAMVLEAATGNHVARLLSELDGEMAPRRDLPLIDGNTVYLGPAQAAVDTWLDAAGGFRNRTRWAVGGRGSAALGGVIGHSVMPGDGLIYLMRVTPEHSGHHPVPWTSVHVYDQDSGNHVGRLAPALEEASHAAAAAAGGGYLFFTDTGQTVPGQRGDTPQMAVVRQGSVPQMVSRNVIPRTRATPVLDGDRLYLNTPGGVLCFAVKDEAGRRYAAEQAAHTLIVEEIDRRPLPRETITLKPIEKHPPSDVPVAVLRNRVLPGKWLFAGPFPLVREQEDLNGRLRRGLQNGYIAPGTVLKHGGIESTFAPLDDQFVMLRGKARVFDGTETVFMPTGVLDIYGALGRQPRRLGYYYTVVYVAHPVFKVYHGRSTGASLWVNEELIEPGLVMHFTPGYYGILVAAGVEGIPPGVKTVTFSPGFREINDPQQPVDAWVAKVRANRSALEDVIAQLPDSPYSRTAADWLRIISRSE